MEINMGGSKSVLGTPMVIAGLDIFNIETVWVRDAGCWYIHG